MSKLLDLLTTRLFDVSGDPTTLSHFWDKQHFYVVQPCLVILGCPTITVCVIYIRDTSIGTVKSFPNQHNVPNRILNKVL